MKVLLAPSETKRPDTPRLKLFAPQNLLFGEIPERQTAIDAYDAFVLNGDTKAHSAFFGLSKPAEIAHYERPVANAAGMKALLRYTGVAFDYLDYPALPETAQNWCDQNVILFSNLLGPVRGGDPIPDYKYKQGAKLPGFAMEKIYREAFGDRLNEFLAGETVVDLRAEWYHKIYPLSVPHVVMTFLKEGKALSHWAKAWRGSVARAIALGGGAELEKLTLPGLRLLEIRQSGVKSNWIFQIA